MDESTDASTSGAAAQPDRRRLARFRQFELHSSLGRVLDVSAAGMRVLCRKPPTGEIEVTLNTEVEPVTVRARVVWTRRIGLRRHEAGVAFLDLDPEASRLLSTLSTPDPHWAWA